MSISRSSTLVPGDLTFQTIPLPDDWLLCVHPQGWIYFYSHILKVVTDQDIRDETVYQLITQHTSDYPLSELNEGMEVQLHVKPQPGGAGAATFYLVVNHKDCIASYEREEVKDGKACTFDPNTLNRRRRLYWNYLWHHPVHVPTPQRAFPDAVDALTWYYTDNLVTGSRSIVPFSKSECEDLSRVLKDMSHPYSDASVAKTVFIAWLLREICSFRDSESYGLYTQKVAQNIRDARALPTANSRRPPRTIVNLIIALLFFGIPRTYYIHVKNSSEYRGRLANVQQNWETYIERLVREYSHFLLISTVLLSATVGLLAVPEINEACRVAATISTLSSLGSIIIGVFSVWRHQTNTRAADSFAYMHNAQHGYLGLYGHAMLLSLPPVLLVWAIVAFTASIVAYTMQGLVNFETLTSVPVWTVLGVFLVLLVAVIGALYTFSIIWKFQKPSWKATLRLKPLWSKVRHQSIDSGRGF
ncbi:hypothetical protein BDZ94DRAFT_1208240 [Collybia nuda]|uniref:Uncharacterized protein n=1 Tax=Collybia nuda TaxID=64659 RepID=A0A9P6CJZ1_9AGAR|nr:hypothetical protein BDZ94DRAFT_1208240 [Collybia nuda]